MVEAILCLGGLRRGAAVLASLPRRPDCLGLLLRFIAFRIGVFLPYHFHPCSPIVRVDTRTGTPVVDLPEPNCCVTIGLEMLVQSHNPGPLFPPPCHMVSPFPGKLRVEPRHEGNSARPAHRLVAVGTGELEAGGGKFVDVRSYCAASVATKFRPKVINCYKQHIRGSCLGKGCAGKEENCGIPYFH